MSWSSTSTSPSTPLPGSTGRSIRGRPSGDVEVDEATVGELVPGSVDADGLATTVGVTTAAGVPPHADTTTVRITASVAAPCRTMLVIAIGPSVSVRGPGCPARPDV